MVIIETSIFTRLIQELQQSLVQHQDLGDLIPGSGGLRKIRWKIEGKGKRGGIRVIYYWITNDKQLWM